MFFLHLLYELENQILDEGKHLPIKLFQLVSENSVRELECHRFVTPSELRYLTIKHQGQLTAKKERQPDPMCLLMEGHTTGKVLQRDWTWMGEASKSSSQMQEIQGKEEYIEPHDSVVFLSNCMTVWFSSRWESLQVKQFRLFNWQIVRKRKR